MNITNRTKLITQFSLLLTIQLILGFTPLGMIMVPPVSITLLHIPVIICGILMGPVWGGALGFVFGSISIFKATTAAVTPIDMAFSPFLSGKPIASLLMGMVPRILVGVFAALLFRLFSRLIKKNALSIGLTAAFTTLLHTIMVLTALALLFSHLGVTLAIVFGAVISINGLLEITAAVIISIPVCGALMKYNRSAKG